MQSITEKPDGSHYEKHLPLSHRLALQHALPWLAYSVMAQPVSVLCCAGCVCERVWIIRIVDQHGRRRTQ